MDADGLWKAWTASMHSKNAPPPPSHEPLQNRQPDAGFAQRPQAAAPRSLTTTAKENLL
jgi:hypothetical protein